MEAVSRVSRDSWRVLEDERDAETYRCKGRHFQIEGEEKRFEEGGDSEFRWFERFHEVCSRMNETLKHISMKNDTSRSKVKRNVSGRFGGFSAPREIREEP